MLDFNNLPAKDKLYYLDTESGQAIYCCDNREVLPLFPDRRFDLVLTDPPYNALNIGPNKREYADTKMQLSENEYRDFCSSWFNLSQPLTERMVFTPGIANTHNYPQPKWELCWHKPASVSFNRMGGFNAWEPIFVYGDTKKVRLGQDYLLFNTLNFIKGEERNHPCPKPMSLWSYLVDIFAAIDNLILDPFLGSGTTTVAAKILGRKCIGIEISEKYCEIAAKRLSQSVMQLEIPNEMIKQEGMI